MRPTVEEMRRAMERGTLVVVSCALASGPLLGADYTRGPNCILCGREVQVSPRGVRQVRAGAEARRLRIEGRARLAYSIHAHRTGNQVAFERLSEQEREAWREIVRFLEDDAECRQCGEVLLCVNCDPEAIYSGLADDLVDHPRLGALLEKWLEERK